MKSSIFPNWVVIPLAIIEIVILLSFSFWFYFTRSVETHRVPDLLGEKMKFSRRFLEKRGYKYRVKWRSSLNSPEGVILNQVPGPGTEIKENRPITIYGSRGPEYITVPDLRGKSLPAAKNYIVRRKKEAESVVGPLLNLGNIARVHSEKIKNNHVILQEPPPGAKVLRGSQLALLVSRGKWSRTTIVPEVEGDSLSKARRILKNHQLKVGEIRHIFRPDSPPSVVLAQTPGARRIVEPGQRVTLTVNLSRPQANSNTNYYTLFKLSPPRGLVPGNMKALLVDEQGERVVFNQEVKPGEEVEFLAAFKGKSRLQIYWNDEIYKIRNLEVPR